MEFCLRKFVCQLTLIAFLFGAVMPFFALYESQLAHAEASELAALYGDKLFICTENGFEWVDVADLAGGKHSPERKSHVQCALCVVSGGGGKIAQLPPVVLALTRHSAQELRLHFTVAPVQAKGWKSAPAMPRAPPYIA